MESRSDTPAPERIVRAKRGRGREGEPIEWTGWAASLECEIEGRPGLEAHDSWDEFEQSDGSHRPPRPPRKAASEMSVLPVPQTDTGRQGEPPPGERANLCQGTRQIDPVPSEEGVP